MTTLDILDFEALLAHIPGENPAGVDLRADASPVSDYQKLKMARNEARDAERRQTKGDASASPDWRPVKERVEAILATQSKDFELAMWLLEALVRLHGFAGLRDGLRLARELAERYWETIYPLPDPTDGIEDRVAILAGLNGLDGAVGPLVRAIHSAPLTAAVGDEEPFAYWHYQQASEIATITDEKKKQQRLEAGAATMDAIGKAIAATPPEFFSAAYDDMSRCLEELEKLTAFLEEHCGVDAYGQPAAPPTTNIREALENCRAFAAEYAPQGEVPPEDGGAALSAAAGNGQTGGAAASLHLGDPQAQIRSREEAFQALLRVARYFKEAEPASPVSYALERIVKWGRMPLPELLAELVSDESTRSSIFKLVGIEPPGAGED